MWKSLLEVITLCAAAWSITNTHTHTQISHRDSQQSIKEMNLDLAEYNVYYCSPIYLYSRWGTAEWERAQGLWWYRESQQDADPCRRWTVESRRCRAARWTVGSQSWLTTQWWRGPSEHSSSCDKIWGSLFASEPGGATAQSCTDTHMTCGNESLVTLEGQLQIVLELVFSVLPRPLRQSGPLCLHG